MAGLQRTFELVPTSLVKSNGPKPPMTSKAAKKAHLLATRGPKVSRAEQRRKDAEELARQKKEYEREKASVKAKAAREKKAAKEQAEREMRRKNGEPEPSKFVRASQPTISFFVRNGKNRGWLEMGAAEESDTTTVCGEEAEQVVKSEGPPAKKVKTGDESEDEYGGFPSFSQSDLGEVLSEFGSSALSEGIQNDQIKDDRATSPEPDSKSKKLPKTASKELRKITLMEVRKVIATKPPEILVSKQTKLEALLPRSKLEKSPKTTPKEPPKTEESLDAFFFENNLDDMAATQLLFEARDATIRFRRHAGETSISKPELGYMAPKSTTSSRPAPPIPRQQPKPPSPLSIKASRSALQERNINMLPPPLPILAKDKRSIPRDQPKRISPKPVETSRLPIQERPVTLPPHPLPIQAKEKRSISFAPSPPKPRLLARSPPQPNSKSPLLPSATQAFLENHLDDFFPSPSQEIRELLDDIDDLPSNTQIARELGPNLQPNAPREDYLADLICTQDVALSSQDILEITTPCPPLSKPKKDEQPISTPTPIPTKPARQPGRRFFEEKDEDLWHAAIQESKMLAEAKEQKVEETNPSARVQETKMPISREEQREERREPPGRTKRAFERSLSNTTDYGEDEFHDCEQELLALC